jgi:hypothetical protein
VEYDSEPVTGQSVDVQLEQLLPSLVAGLPDLLDDLEKLLLDLAPSYSNFIADRRNVVLAASEAAVRSLVSIATEIWSDTTQQENVWRYSVDQTLFEEIGRIQWREGIPVGTLLSAYQLGARLAWRQMSDRALRNELPSEALAALAESVFCFVDRLSSASAAGYLAEQSEAAAERERCRDELVELLLSDRSSTTSVLTAARRAGWPVPNTAAVIFIEPHNEAGRAVLSRLDQNCLRVQRAGLLGAIVPDPAAPNRRQRLATTLRGSSAVVGHTVVLEHLAASARIAEIAARLQHERVLTQDPVFVDEHLDAIIVHREPKLLDALLQQCLEPLERLPVGSREAFRATLRSWLRNMGDRRAMAAELHIHPQTVRYRLARLRELFGGRLDDPDSRLPLMLALAWDP